MSSSNEAILVVDGGERSGETIAFRGPITTIGRAAANDVVLAEPAVSRRHAEIVKADGGFHIRDAGSTGGTHLNNERTPPEGRLLKDGDTITVGTVSLVFYSPIPPTVEVTVVLDRARETSKFEVAAYDEEDELYEGTVRLSVHAEGPPGPVVAFAQRLDKKPECRLIRMSNNVSSGVDVWLALREPVSLRQLLRVEGVAEVSATRGRDLSPESDDAPLTVLLKRPSS